MSPPTNLTRILSSLNSAKREDDMPHWRSVLIHDDVTTYVVKIFLSSIKKSSRWNKSLVKFKILRYIKFVLFLAL